MGVESVMIFSKKLLNSPKKKFIVILSAGSSGLYYSTILVTNADTSNDLLCSRID